MFSKAVILSLFVATAIAAPSPPVPAVPEETGGKVLFCSNRFAGGVDECDTIDFTFGQCMVHINRLSDKVSYVDPNKHKCRFYDQSGCRDDGKKSYFDTDVLIDDIRGHDDPRISTHNDDTTAFICVKEWKDLA